MSPIGIPPSRKLGGAGGVVFAKPELCCQTALRGATVYRPFALLRLVRGELLLEQFLQNPSSGGDLHSDEQQCAAHLHSHP